MVLSRSDSQAVDPLGPTRVRRREADTADPHEGRTFAGRWKVGARIGMGGMASVYEAEDLRLLRKVAIKILHPHVASHPESRKRLAREARAIARLDDPNVIGVFDYSDDDKEVVWLATELVRGPSLREFLETAPTPSPEVAAMITIEILSALKSAHASGVVHRDVKPDNILIDAHGRVRLSDFGIAQLSESERLTMTGHLIGSPSYMSPEQAETRPTDHRSDIFSTGALLYRLITGRVPFKGENAISTLRKVAAADFTDPSTLTPHAPEPILQVIRKAMSPLPEDRFQTAHEMMKPLQHFIIAQGLGSPGEELPKYFSDPFRFGARQEQIADTAIIRKRKASTGPRLEALRRVAWTLLVSVSAIAVVSGALFATDSFEHSDTFVAAEPLIEARPPARFKATMLTEPQTEAPKVEPQQKRAKKAAPKPLAEAPGEGILQIGASRWADVYIDGSYVGRAPSQTRFSLPEGPHTLLAKNPHCVAVRREIHIRADQTTRTRLLLECSE